MRNVLADAGWVPAGQTKRVPTSALEKRRTTDVSSQGVCSQQSLAAVREEVRATALWVWLTSGSCERVPDAQSITFEESDHQSVLVCRDPIGAFVRMFPGRDVVCVTRKASGTSVNVYI